MMSPKGTSPQESHEEDDVPKGETPQEGRPGATKLLSEDVFQGVDTSTAKIEADVAWVADHLQAQEEFEKARAKKIKKLHKQFVWKSYKYYKMGEDVFEATSLKNLRAAAQKQVDANTVHIF